MRAVAALAIIALAACKSTGSLCDADVKREAWDMAVESCRRAYEHDAAPRIGRQLATASLRTGDVERAESLASRLLASDEAPAAHLLLGDVARARGDGDIALHRYSLALAHYTLRGDDRGRARAAYQLAGTAKERGRYGLAVDAQQIARQSAERAGDTRMVMYANLAGAIILRATGDMIASEQAMARALSAAITPRDRAWVKLTQGLSYLDANLETLAGTPLRDVLTLSNDPTLVGAAHLNLAFLARSQGHAAEAVEHLRLAEQAGAEAFDIDLLRAQLAVDRGAHDEAAKLLADIAARPLQDRWTWVVPLWQGRNDEARGDAVGAESHYRTALAAAEQLRAQAGRLEPHVLVKHREVYERLIGVLARAGRWNDALLVIARLDAGTRTHVETARDASTVLNAWRGRELVIIVRGGERAWRLHVHDGAVNGVDAGDADALERSATELLAAPDNEALAASLGTAILGDTRGASPLYVLPVGAFGNVPIAALRIADRFVIGQRPLIRALALTPRRMHAAATAPPVVLGDPRGDLPGAAREARTVAAALGVEALLGASATRASIEYARSKLLHVAAHAQSTLDGSKLVLADGALDADEILALPSAPAIVVLASCGSAAARDIGGWGSLASAFLGAGSDIVIATSWTIRDETAVEIVAELYRQGVLDDPAGALARAQHVLATRGEIATREWAAFNALGAAPSQ